MGKHSNEDYNESWLRQQIKDLEYKKKILNVYIYTTDRKKELDQQLSLMNMKVVVRTIYKFLRNRKPVVDYWIYKRLI